MAFISSAWIKCMVGGGNGQKNLMTAASEIFLCWCNVFCVVLHCVLCTTRDRYKVAFQSNATTCVNF